MLRRQNTIALLCAAVLLASCTRTHAPPAASAQLSSEIQEASGMTRSQRDPGIMWVHGDSGTPPVVFGVNAKGEVVTRAELLGSANIDWEDITIADGHMYVGDIGNNGQARRDLAVLVLPEPDPGLPSSSVSALKRVPWRFPDQAEFPAKAENFDAESLFWARGALHLLSKHRADTLTTVYRFGSLDPAGVTLEKLDSFDVGGAELRYGGMVTAAEANAAGSQLAVLSYHALFVFDIDHGGPLLSKLISRTEFDMDQLQQCEALAWRDDTIVIANEDGRVFEIDAAARASDKPFPAPSTR